MHYKREARCIFCTENQHYLPLHSQGKKATPKHIPSAHGDTPNTRTMPELWGKIFHLEDIPVNIPEVGVIGPLFSKQPTWTHHIFRRKKKMMMSTKGWEFRHPAEQVEESFNFLVFGVSVPSLAAIRYLSTNISPENFSKWRFNT